MVVKSEVFLYKKQWRYTSSQRKKNKNQNKSLKLQLHKTFGSSVPRSFCLSTYKSALDVGIYCLLDGILPLNRRQFSPIRESLKRRLSPMTMCKMWSSIFMTPSTTNTFGVNEAAAFLSPPDENITKTSLMLMSRLLLSCRPCRN